MAFRMLKRIRYYEGNRNTAYPSIMQVCPLVERKM